MKTHTITKDQLDAENYYIGSENLESYEGNIEIESSLGFVRFQASLSAKGYIFAKAGSGIEAGEGIKAGWGIEAGWGIKAGEGIEAGWGIKAGRGIKAGWGIEAGWGIKAGEGIEAGWGIKAGRGIEAGWGIKAGEGIVSTLSIRCKLTLSASLRIIAGICWWRKVESSDFEIECGKLVSGDIVLGMLIERGLPEEVAPNTDPLIIAGVEFTSADIAKLATAINACSPS